MSWALNAQTCGSVIVIGAFAASEAGSHYLSAHPGSNFAWYVNLHLFRPFEAARVATSPLRGLFGPDAVWVAFLALALTLLLRAFRMRFGLALISNLSLVFVAFLTQSWMQAGGATRSAALGGAVAAPSGDNLLIAFLLLASLVAAAFGHLSFLKAAGEGAPRPRPD